MSTEQSPEEIYRRRKEDAKTNAYAQLLMEIDIAVLRLEVALKDSAIRLKAAGYPGGELRKVELSAGVHEDHVFWDLSSYPGLLGRFSIDAYGNLYSEQHVRWGRKAVLPEELGRNISSLPLRESVDGIVDQSIGRLTQDIDRLCPRLAPIPPPKPRGWFARIFQ